MSLPEPKKIMYVSQRLAILDAIISPEWEYRYYSFNNSWDLNQQMASMKDGSGNEYFILFENNNCGIKVYSKNVNEECKRFIRKHMKSENHFISGFLKEPAFSIDDSTFLSFWNHEKDKWISCGKDKDICLHILSDPINDYYKFSKEYYEKDIPIDIINRIFLSESIEREIVLKINSKIDLDEFIKEANEIGLKHFLHLPKQN